MKHTIRLIQATTFSVALAAASMAQAGEPNVAMGQGLYEQQGANSCLYCHGVDGNGGKVAVAAKLTQPKTWKSYKGLGGDAAFAKDKAGFLKNLADSVTDLILKGALAHNATYKNPAYDSKKAGGAFNAQMYGLTAAPSVAWLNKFKDKGVTKDLAAKSVYLYIQKFDTQGVFK